MKINGYIPTPAIIGIAQSPSPNDVTFLPHLLTTPTPSLPPTAGNDGFNGYVPK